MMCMIHFSISYISLHTVIICSIMILRWKGAVKNFVWKFNLLNSEIVDAQEQIVPLSYQSIISPIQGC